MIKKGTKLYSILFGSCPKCQEESMYVNKNPYAINDVIKMHDHCSNCHTKYNMEPSFFYGSMYVSYGVGVAVAVAAFIISYVFMDATPNQSFLSILGTLIVFAPFIMRISRNIWINFFVHYDKSLVKKS